MRIHIDVEVRATKDKVWQAYTSAEDIVNWNFASDDWHTTTAAVDLRVGGRFASRMEAKDGSMGFDFEGVYTNVIVGELIEYEFGGRMASIEFAETISGTHVAIAFDAEDEHPVELQKNGWQAILNNFKNYVENQH